MLFLPLAIAAGLLPIHAEGQSQEDQGEAKLFDLTLPPVASTLFHGEFVRFAVEVRYRGTEPFYGHVMLPGRVTSLSLQYPDGSRGGIWIGRDPLEEEAAGDVLPPAQGQRIDLGFVRKSEIIELYLLGRSALSWRSRG